MPGIVGRVGGAPPQPAEPDRVLEIQRHFPFYGRAHDGDHLGWLGWVGVGDAGPRVGRDPGGRHVVVYHGDGAARWTAQRAVEAADAIATRPAALADALGGSFALACLDLDRGALHCLTDRFGHHRLYYRRQGDAVYVAAELKAFLAWPDLDVAPDVEALRDLVNYTYPLGDRTSLAGVRLLPPASRLSFAGGELTVERYWRPRYEPHEDDDDRLVDEAQRLFSEAFARKTAEADRLVVPVSGGLDSRLLLAEALAEGKEVLSYTYGHARSRETAVAREVMRALGVAPRHIVTDDVADPAPAVRRASWFVEGMANAGVAGLVRVQGELLHEPRSPLFVNGIYGGPTNFSTSYHKPDELVEGLSREEKVARIGATMFSRQLRSPANYRKLRPDFARTCAEGYDREIARLLTEHESVSPLFGYQKDAFYIDNRLCRFMNQIDVNRYFWNEVMPLTSAPLYDFYLHLPERLKARRLLHRRLLARHYPRAAAAVVYGTGISVVDELAGRPPAPPRTDGRLRHVLSRLTLGRYNPPNPASYGDFDYVYRRNRRLRAFYEDVLGDERPLSSDVFDFTVVREYLRQCRRGAKLFAALATVMAWELWLRQLKARRWDV